ncbi:MAG: GtrA family protein [Desulforhopalus sp.]|nr:GtrA family protein [Desulforhopalus sp.]
MNNYCAEKMIRSFGQVIRYAVVGVLSNLLGYLVYLMATYLGAAPKLTMTLLYGVGASVGFIGNRKLTFMHKGRVLSSGLRYCVAHCLGYCINLALLYIFVDNLGYSHQWIQAIAIFIVAGFLFIALKFFVFIDLNPAIMESK